jgi:hypothetical protein
VAGYGIPQDKGAQLTSENLLFFLTSEKIADFYRQLLIEKPLDFPAAFFLFLPVRPCSFFWKQASQLGSICRFPLIVEAQRRKIIADLESS